MGNRVNQLNKKLQAKRKELFKLQMEETSSAIDRQKLSNEIKDLTADLVICQLDLTNVEADIVKNNNFSN
ncbi:hypothetical protein [Alkalibacterium olivapovliticus]|uniref:Uncharacterized protein n=1 Tax=Alkalibacterium olivapovliticus TaxID=99907 RepID=A0A2T0VTW6_9LACT|nr:hypothetical protein [Alkalibacterium olivapovliticus]PRY74750.1 hypothetical protein CLV38_1396 [Alkalibacterium olivapovliticus]